VPEVLNVADAEPDGVSGMSAGAPREPSNVTLCVVAKFHCTDWPTLIVTEFGENVSLSVALTVAAAAADVTVIGVGPEPAVTPPAVAETLMFVEPVATPVTRPEELIVAFAMTDELHVSVDAIALPN
jgi:hypothetical protein